MFQDDPTFALINFAIAGYLFYLWFGDFLHFKKTGEFRKGALQGATTVPLKLVVSAMAIAIALLVIHTFTEISLGVENQQTKVSFWALFSWVGAAFVEELIFRGYLVVQNKGQCALICSILFFSVVFALGHPFLWDYTVADGASIFAGEWKWNFTLQAANSTLSILECSLLFYCLRFVSMNKNRSILPCVAAHCAYNVGVFITKLAQGFVV